MITKLQVTSADNVIFDTVEFIRLVLGMAGKFGGYDDDEDDVLLPKEPQVTSQDPDERKCARALRIKRRQDALKR